MTEIEGKKKQSNRDLTLDVSLVFHQLLLSCVFLEIRQGVIDETSNRREDIETRRPFVFNTRRTLREKTGRWQYSALIRYMIFPSGTSVKFARLSSVFPRLP